MHHEIKTTLDVIFKPVWKIPRLFGNWKKITLLVTTAAILKNLIERKHELPNYKSTIIVLRSLKILVLYTSHLLLQEILFLYRHTIGCKKVSLIECSMKILPFALIIFYYMPSWFEINLMLKCFYFSKFWNPISLWQFLWSWQLH